MTNSDFPGGHAHSNPLPTSLYPAGQQPRMTIGRARARGVLSGLDLALALPVLLGAFLGRAQLPPADTTAGYVALLLVNETPFPGERGWVSEDDTKEAMLSILCVLDSRLRHIPGGYRQEQIAAEQCDDIIDVITAGGEKGQCDGFYRDKAGKFVAVARVHTRIDYLVECANRGKPGRFAKLLDHASQLATKYVEGGMAEADQFASLTRVGKVEVTGRAYSWMTDQNNYNPGGNFVRIPDSDRGAKGGNRFFTLRKLK